MIRRPPRSTRTDTSFPTRRSSDLQHFTFEAQLVGSYFFLRDRVERVAENGSNIDEIPRLVAAAARSIRSEEHTSELQSLMRISYAVFCLKKKKIQLITNNYSAE